VSDLIRPQFTTIDGLSVRFAESGDGDQDAILLSPWPESVYAFEPAWQRLASHAHLLAVDPPGFGKSDYRESLMNPKAMGNFIIRIADTFGFEIPISSVPILAPRHPCLRLQRSRAGFVPWWWEAEGPQCRWS
jgi:pimeloyl-ACP methyl ester carboxylesterase